MQLNNDALVKAIDKAVADVQGSSFRQHLGASVIGKPCGRDIWYSFHWAHNVHHSGRLLRLFNRGHREEHHVVRWLKNIGAKVAELDPATNKQWHFSDINGMFAGSCDGVLNLPAQFHGMRGNGILEIKTHGLQSFAKLRDGVRIAKPEHFVQMQIYMHYFKCGWALYFSVCKNDDQIHAEIVPYSPHTAQMYIQKATNIINAPLPPKKIHDDPSFFLCKFCDHKRICHEGAPPDTNCRTCSFVAVKDGHWVCNQFGAVIPDDFQPKGCSRWVRGF